MSVILHHITKGSGLNRLWMSGLKMIALEIAVIRYFPVGAMDDAMTDIRPLVHAFLGNIVHHCTEIAADIDIAVGVEHSKDQPTLFMTGELHQVTSSLADLTELWCIGNRPQRAVGLEGPAMVGAAE